MKVYVVLAALVVVALSGPVPENEDDEVGLTYFLIETDDGGYEIEDLVNDKIDTRAAESDLTYHFFSRHDPDRGTTLKSSDIGILRDTEFAPTKDSVFVVHGWRDHNESTYNTYMREILLSRYDVNIFIVDWEPIAGKNYISAKNSVVAVGTYIALFIQSLVATYGLDLSKVSFVGHSLGAHVAGNAGAALGGQIDYIVGLDPAGPGFSSRNTGERLDPTDAKFVEVIHTNGGLLGFRKPIGHADYYPNGGSSQPGCGIDITGSCAHARSYAYFAESIIAETDNFLATQCSGYILYLLGFCKSSTSSRMAGFEVDHRATGKYYLKTNGNAPYARS